MLLSLLLIERDVRGGAARGSCPRAESAVETRWLCEREEQRRRAEAMQRRMPEEGRGFHSCLSCPEAQQGETAASETMLTHSRERNGSG